VTARHALMLDASAMLPAACNQAWEAKPQQPAAEKLTCTLMLHDAMQSNFIAHMHDFIIQLFALQHAMQASTHQDMPG